MKKPMMWKRMTIAAFGWLLFFPIIVLAGELDLNPSGSKFFDVENAAPGDEHPKTFSAENDGAESADLFLEVDDVTNDAFAKRLKFFLIDKSSGKYLIGGAGDRYTLDKMNEEGRVFVERLDPGEKNEYKARLTFDEDAGNEWQDKKVVFDFDFHLVSEAAAIGSPIPLRPNVPEGGIAPETEEAGGSNGATISEEPEEVGSVAGATEELCSSWPWWKWLLLVLVHMVLFNVKQMSHSPFIKRWGMTVQAGSTAAAFILWYLFDGCREYWPEIPIVIFAVSFVSIALFRWVRHTRDT